ncbi:guanine deaminase [Aestuariispira insulae]|uniref:Guanine deaminase n=1 Tax=Aestuariispira insulae TaxID=1461337 RepID=A0A3D9HWH4_9PROT|nr:guanine deaminase [Aestuariispira insulae]RED53852.1 guanine deaminase [Aestuariispira insulae]
MTVRDDLPSNAKRQVLKGAYLTFTGDPFKTDPADCYLYESDGLVVLKDGKVEMIGTRSLIEPELAELDYELTDYSGSDKLIMPGFVDCHVHYPQLPIIGAYGTQLLDWLNKYTFVAEQAYSDIDYAKAVAEVFFKELLRAGTTTAAAFCTVHPQSVDAFFSEAAKLDLRMVAGKVMMDRHAPEALTDTAQSGYDQSKALIEKWHGNGRALYALTPRFAPTSTPEQLEATGALRREHEGVYVQSHLSENTDEIAWVKDLFPGRKGYLDVYDHYGLIGEKTVYGHCIHLTEDEWGLIHESGTAIAACPTSNLFLGSGLFDLDKAKMQGKPVKVGMSTDVGGGTSLSMLQTLNEFYKVTQLNKFSLNAIRAYYLATRGAAESLYLGDKIGSLETGMEADLIVMDLRSTPLIDFRMNTVKDIEETLFVQMTMADDRAILATYANGRLVHARD